MKLHFTNNATTARVVSTSMIIILMLLVTSSPSSSFTLADNDGCSFISQRSKCGHLTCNVTTGNCMPCTSSDQCRNRAMGCTFESSANENQCRLMPVSDYAELVDDGIPALIGAVLIAIVAVTIGVIAGVGGGGVMVGLFKVTLGLALTDAVALSLAAIAGQGLYNVFIQARRNHPKFQPPGPTRPLINYQLITLYTPPTLAGVMYGNLVGKVIPDAIRLFSMAIFFVYILQRTIKKVFAQREKDLAALKKKATDDAKNNYGGANNNNNIVSSSSSNTVARTALGSPAVSTRAMVSLPTTPDARSKNASSRNNTNNTNNDSSDDEDDTETDAHDSLNNNLLDEDEQRAAAADEEDDAHKLVEIANEKQSPEQDSLGREQYPLKIYGLIILVFIPVLSANSLKTLIFKCNTSPIGYWLTLVFASAYCLIFFLLYRSSLKKLADQDDANEAEGGDDDQRVLSFKFNSTTSVLYPFIGFMSGCLSSLFGIGGGMILNILFLDAGLTPEETAASGGTCTFVIALLSLLQFIVQGNARYDYSLIFFGAGMCATFIGQKILMPQIKKRGWSFLIIVCLCIIMFGSLLVSLGVGIYDAVIQINNEGIDALDFGNYCPAAKGQ